MKTIVVNITQATVKHKSIFRHMAQFQELSVVG